MIINNTEFQFDIFDVNTFARYTNGADKVRKALMAAAEMAKKGELVSSARIQCSAIKDMFDDVFGPGAGENACGKDDNIRSCLEAYRQLLTEEQRQAEEQEKLTDEILRLQGLSDEQIKKSKQLVIPIRSEVNSATQEKMQEIAEVNLDESKLEEILAQVTDPMAPESTIKKFHPAGQLE